MQLILSSAIQNKQEELPSLKAEHSDSDISITHAVASVSPHSMLGSCATAERRTTGAPPQSPARKWMPAPCGLTLDYGATGNSSQVQLHTLPRARSMCA